eukprot:1064587-Prymnesium_polylepis.1
MHGDGDARLERKGGHQGQWPAPLCGRRVRFSGRARHVVSSVESILHAAELAREALDDHVERRPAHEWCRCCRDGVVGALLPNI